MKTVQSIVPTPYPENKEGKIIVGIRRMSVTYVQEADTNSEPDEEQTLTIETEDVPYGEPGLKSYYLNISTGKWSIGGTKEIQHILEDFAKRLETTIDDVEID